MLHALLLSVLVAAPPAGSIFGDLRLGERYLSEVTLSLKCGEETVEGKTDKTGSFRLSVKSGGKCQLTVAYEKQTPSIEIVVFEKPARYRLVLESKDSTYTLKRV